jgi:hypothetical protein
LQKKAIALTFILLTLLASITTVVYYGSPSIFCKGENSSASESTSPPEPVVSFTYWDVPSGSILQSPTIIILSPQDNETFSSNNVTLKVNVGSQSWIIMGVYYEADWIEGYHRIFTFQPSWGYVMSLKVAITANFTEIPDGRHNITVYSNTHDGSHASSSVFFITDTSSPRISVLSIENKTYSPNELWLNFTTDEPTSWIGYCLDGKANLTISGNTTLSGLSNGSHSVVIYANDTAGNSGASELVTFSIDTPEPFPTAYSMGIVAVIVLILLGSIVYILKRKH